MKIGRPLVIGGGFVLLFGIIFYLQGLSVVGPEASFMYSNPEWVTNGIEISVVGSIILGIGILVWIKK